VKKSVKESVKRTVKEVMKDYLLPGLRPARDNCEQDRVLRLSVSQPKEAKCAQFRVSRS
jgi:hypothetical protein